MDIFYYNGEVTYVKFKASLLNESIHFGSILYVKNK